MGIRYAKLSDSERIHHTHKASIKTLCAGHYCEQDLTGWVDILSHSIYENAIKEKTMIVAEDKNALLGKIEISELTFKVLV